MESVLTKWSESVFTIRVFIINFGLGSTIIYIITYEGKIIRDRYNIEIEIKALVIKSFGPINDFFP